MGAEPAAEPVAEAAEPEPVPEAVEPAAEPVAEAAEPEPVPEAAEPAAEPVAEPEPVTEAEPDAVAELAEKHAEPITVEVIPNGETAKAASTSTELQQEREQPNSIQAHEAVPVPKKAPTKQTKRSTAREEQVLWSYADMLTARVIRGAVDKIGA